MEFLPMSPDEVQRTMQFLLSQQAQFAADLANLDSRFERLTVKTDQIAEGLIGLTGIVDRLADGLGQVTDGIVRLTEAQRRTDEHLRELKEHIQTVESHLDDVGRIFERHLREDHERRLS